MFFNKMCFLLLLVFQSPHHIKCIQAAELTVCGQNTSTHFDNFLVCLAILFLFVFPNDNTTTMKNESVVISRHFCLSNQTSQEGLKLTNSKLFLKGISFEYI